jgi:hypothetical protein
VAALTPLDLDKPWDDLNANGYQVNPPDIVVRRRMIEGQRARSNRPIREHTDVILHFAEVNDMVVLTRGGGNAEGWELCWDFNRLERRLAFSLTDLETSFWHMTIMLVALWNTYLPESFGLNVWSKTGDFVYEVNKHTTPKELRKDLERAKAEVESFLPMDLERRR